MSEPPRDSSALEPAVNPAGEPTTGEPIDGPGSLRPVASARHTVVLLVILTVVAISGAAGASRGSARPAVTHLAQYTTLLVMEWLLFAFVLRGLRAAGTPLADVMGRRWSSAADLWKPVVAAAAFWCVKTLVLLGLQLGLDAAHLGGAADARRIASWLLPQAPIEAVLWVALSISAGFCEEVLYRGYLQRQLSAFTRHTGVGLLLSALVFGLSHAYQGPTAVIRITVYGVLFGVLASWTRSLRSGIIAHAAEDIVSGLVPR